jgi:hypothetical protein
MKTEQIEELSRNQIIELLLKNQGEYGEDFNTENALQNLGSKGKTLQKEVQRIVKENPNTFSSLTQFIDHAIKMQLIWWGKKPEIMNDLIASNVRTVEQKQYWKDFQEQIKNGWKSELEENRDEEEFEQLKINISECYKGELKFNESSKKNLIYDTYPILWKYYSRLLPIKATLHIIKYIAEKQGTDYFEVTEDNLELAYNLLSNIGDILSEFDEVVKHKKNQKLSVGFPTNNKSSSNSDKIKSTIAKSEGNKNRFKTHTIGKKSSDKIFSNIKQRVELNQPNTDKKRYEDFIEKTFLLMSRCSLSEKFDEITLRDPNWEEMKQLFDDTVKITKKKIENSEGAFQGALNALDLIIPYYDKERKTTMVYISKNGYEFLGMRNPILDDLTSLEAASKQKDQKVVGGFSMEIFENEEVQHIVGELIPTKLSLEYNIITTIISEFIDNEVELDSNKIEKLIINTCVDWALEYPEMFEGHEIDAAIGEARYLEKFGDKWLTVDNMPTNAEINAWRIATMGRLAEMGVVEWKMKDGGQGAAIYSRGKKFDIVKDLPKLSRRDIIDKRDDYQKILQKSD